MEMDNGQETDSYIKLAEKINICLLRVTVSNKMEGSYKDFEELKS